MSAPINLTEDQVAALLNWPLVCDAVEQALRSVCETRVSDDQPTSMQPARSKTLTDQGKNSITFSFVDEK